jgi:hypothetical protein
MTMDVTSRVAALRKQLSQFEAERLSAERDKQQAETELKFLGWDGTTTVQTFVDDLRERRAETEQEEERLVEELEAKLQEIKGQDQP